MTDGMFAPLPAREPARLAIGRTPRSALMKRCLPIVTLLVGLLSTLAAAAADTGAADELVRLPGEVPPAVMKATRLSTSPALDARVTLTIVLNRNDQRGFDAFLRDVKDPS